MAKDFSGINTGRVYGNIETATSKKGQQGAASPQEAAQRAAALKTQGRKGCKLGRMNMAFTPENYDFIHTVSRATGQNLTAFTNKIITQYREEHIDTYEKAKALLKELDGADDAADDAGPAE